MKQTRNILMAVFCGSLAVAGCLVALFELDILVPGVLNGSDATAEFLLQTLMELLTLVAIPLALKLFKLKKVHAQLVAHKHLALRSWGLLRLALLLVPMLVNTLLYYLYMNTAFGYMAIILVLCLPFVFPSMSRCLAETEES